MIESAEHLHHALSLAAEGMTPQEIARAAQDKQSPIRVLGAMYRRYWRATDAARKFGHTGVHRFTFAERRLMTFQRRAGLDLS
jgi:hypothetical protein